MISGLNASNLNTDPLKHKEGRNKSAVPPHHSSAHTTHATSTSSFNKSSNQSDHLLVEPVQSENWERVEFSRENIYKFTKVRNTEMGGEGGDRIAETTVGIERCSSKGVGGVYSGKDSVE